MYLKPGRILGTEEVISDCLLDVWMNAWVFLCTWSQSVSRRGGTLSSLVTIVSSSLTCNKYEQIIFVDLMYPVVMMIIWGSVCEGTKIRKLWSKYQKHCTLTQPLNVKSGKILLLTQREQRQEKSRNISPSLSFPLVNSEKELSLEYLSQGPLEGEPQWKHRSPGNECSLRLFFFWT